ncbi:hemagglutinin repeat-containing protein [Rickettsiales bacterium LUAb2]
MLFLVLSSAMRAIKKAIAILVVASFMWFEALDAAKAAVNIAIINKAGSNTNSLKSANGIPIVNINKPNSKGVSNNEYNNLDVGKEGLIFNNSGDLVDTKLAGWIGANNNFGKDEHANLIVNTVRSKRSELGGYMEVAGASSDLIILNTNGIVCDGCGFINVNRGVLSTGEAVFGSDGSLEGIKVRGGEVEIGRGGFNGAEANRIDIISQKLRLDGEIYGKDVSILLGREDYDYKSGSSVGVEEGTVADYVISSSQFGGIYGSAIELVSKEQSIGVNVDFSMATSGSKLTVDAAGNLTINNKLSSNNSDLELKAANINIGNKGSLYSNNDTNIYSTNLNIENGANLYSKGNYYLTGSSLTSSGNIHSQNNLELNFNNISLLNGLLSANNQINIAGSLINISNEVNSKNINLTGDDINIYGSVIGDNLGITSNDQLLIAGNVSSNQDINLISKNLNITKSLQSKGNITVTAANADISGKVSSEQNITLNSSNTLDITGEVNAKGVNLTAANTDIYGTIGGDTINITGKDQLLIGGYVNSNQDINLTSKNLNITKNVESKGNITVTTDNANISGTVNSEKNITLNTNNTLDITGEINSNLLLAINTSNLNLAGKLWGGNLFTVNANQFKLTGLASSLGNININSNSLEIDAGEINGSNIDIEASSININNGAVKGSGAIGNVKIKANDLGITGASELTANGNFILNLANDFNLKGTTKIGSNGNFSLAAKNINIYAGSKLSSNGKLDVTANNLKVGVGNSPANNNNQATYLDSIGDFTLNINNTIDVQAKSNLTSKGLLTVNADTVNNRGFIAGNNINFRVWNLNNIGNERIGDSHNSSSNRGAIYAVNNIDIKGRDGGRAKSIVNSSARIEAHNGDINILANTFTNTVSWYDIIDNSSDWYNVYTDKVTEQTDWGNKENVHKKEYDQYRSTTYETRDQRDIKYDVFVSSGAVLTAGGNINIDVNTFNNTSSTISSIKNTTIKADTVNNQTIGKQNYTDVKIYSYVKNEHRGNRCDVHWPSYSRCGMKYFDPWTDNYQNNAYQENYSFSGLDGGHISASGNIVINAGSYFGNGSKDEHVRINQGEGSTWDTSSNVNNDTKGNGNVSVDGTQEITIDGNKIINVDGNMFDYSDGTNGYVIESNPYFTDLDKFKGSDYYLGLLGITVDKSHKILGDNGVDLETVTNQIMDETGKKTLDGYDNTESQMEDLMQAGLDEKDKLGLEVGREPTSEQLKNLDKPIIWWVSENINGEDVLVPKVYFPSKDDNKEAYNKDRDNGGSSINAGGTVTINVEGDGENNGSITANEGITIDAGGDFTNNGTIKNKDNSKEVIEKINGLQDTLDKNNKEADDLFKQYNDLQDQYKNAETNYNNELNNYNNKENSYNQLANNYKAKQAEYEALLAKINNRHSKYSGKVWTADIDNKKADKENSSIETQLVALEQELNNLGNTLDKQGQELNNLGEHLNNSGSNLNSLGENINGKATRINELNDQSQKIVKELDGYENGTSIKGVDIKAGGSVNNEGIIEADRVAIETANNLNNITGVVNASLKADIKAKEVTNYGGTINSGGNLKIEANQITNESATRTDTTTGKYFSYSSTKLSSTGKITAGNDLTIKATNLNIKGAYVGAGGNANIEVTNINLSNIALEENYQQYDKQLSFKKGKPSFVAGDVTEQSTNINTFGAMLDIGGDLTLKAANDINLLGSSINVTKNANISATGNISLVNTYDVAESSSKHGKNSSYNYNSEVVGSSINTGGNISLTGNDVNLVGSNINTKGDTTIIANNINMVGAYNTNIVDTVSVTKKKKLFSSKTTKEHTHQEDYTISGSGINGEGKTNLVSSNNINVAASNVSGSEVGLYAGSKLDDKGNVIASGNLGNVNLINMDDKHNYEHTKEVKKRGLSKNMFDNAISFDNGFKEQISLGYNDYKKETSNSTNVVGSNIKTSNGDINIKATGGDITSISSNLEATKDINMSGNNINLLTAQNTSSSTSYHKHEELKYTVGIGNSYLDAANAAVNLGKSIDHVEKAGEDLIRTQKAHNNGSASSAAVDDSMVNGLLAEADLANNVFAASGAYNAAIDAAKGVSGSCISSLCTGIYITTGLQYETSTQYSEAHGSEEIGNNLNGANINLNANNNITIEGGNIAGSDKVTLAANDINIRAAEKVDNNISMQNSNTTSVSVSSSGGISANFSHQSSSGSESSKAYTNAKITGNEIEVKANNLTGKGTNIDGDTVKLNISNNLSLETVQDEHRSSSKSSGYGFGLSYNGANSYIPSGVNGNINQNKSYNESIWSKEASSIRGKGKVTIDVGNKLTNKGSIIGSETGDLTLSAKEIELEDLHNSSYSKNKGFGVSMGLGFSSNQGENKIYPNGKTTISVKNSKIEESSTSKATIGKGDITADTITYNGKEAKLDENGTITTASNQGNTTKDSQVVNQDVTNNETEKQTYTSRKLDGNVTIDNRLLTSAGRQDIYNQVNKSVADLSNKYDTAYKTISKLLTKEQIIELNQAQKELYTALNKKLNAIDHLDEQLKAAKNPKEVDKILANYKELCDEVDIKANKVLSVSNNIEEDLNKKLEGKSIEEKEMILNNINGYQSFIIDTIEEAKADGKKNKYSGKYDKNLNEAENKMLDVDSIDKLVTIAIDLQDYDMFTKYEKTNQNLLNHVVIFEGNGGDNNVIKDANGNIIGYKIYDDANPENKNSKNKNTVAFGFKIDELDDETKKQVLHDGYMTKAKADQLYIPKIEQNSQYANQSFFNIIAKSEGQYSFSQHQYNAEVEHDYNFSDKRKEALSINIVNAVSSGELNDDNRYLYTKMDTEWLKQNEQNKKKPGLNGRRGGELDNFYNGNLCTNGGKNDCYGPERKSIISDILQDINSNTYQTDPQRFNILSDKE